jgi:hypothetical protein
VKGARKDEERGEGMRVDSDDGSDERDKEGESIVVAEYALMNEISK